MAHKRLEEAAAGHATLAHRRACQKQRHGLLQARFQEGREIVTSGLKGGENVVVDGALALTNGARVEIRNAEVKKGNS